jgi:hypothetical protein
MNVRESKHLSDKGTTCGVVLLNFWLLPIISQLTPVLLTRRKVHVTRRTPRLLTKHYEPPKANQNMSPFPKFEQRKAPDTKYVNSI